MLDMLFVLIFSNAFGIWFAEFLNEFTAWSIAVFSVDSVKLMTAMVTGKKV